MTLSLVDETDLLTALYAGVTDRAVWHTFAARLRARTEAQGCAIWIRPISDETWRLVRADGTPQSPSAEDFPHISKLRPNRVYTAEELQASPLWHGRYMRVHLPGEVELVIALLRQIAGDDFRAGDSALLSSLAPHLSIALQLLARMENLQLSRLSAAETAERFGLGWIKLDERGQVVEMDPGAARMIDEGKLIHKAGDGRLRFVHVGAEMMLDSALRTPDSLQAGQRGAWLATAPPIQLTVEKITARQTLSLPKARFLLQFRRLARCHVDNRELVMALFGLGSSEASLALYIADGLTIAEAGEKLGLTLETARNYSKRIYAITGTSGQVQLASLLLRGVTGKGAF